MGVVFEVVTVGYPRGNAGLRAFERSDLDFLNDGARGNGPSCVPSSSSFAFILF